MFRPIIAHKSSEISILKYSVYLSQKHRNLILKGSGPLFWWNNLVPVGWQPVTAAPLLCCFCYFCSVFVLVVFVCFSGVMGRSGLWSLWFPAFVREPLVTFSKGTCYHWYSNVFYIWQHLACYQLLAITWKTQIWSQEKSTRNNPEDLKYSKSWRSVGLEHDPWSLGPQTALHYKQERFCDGHDMGSVILQKSLSMNTVLCAIEKCKLKVYHTK